jgi:hypothetical protein
MEIKRDALAGTEILARAAVKMALPIGAAAPQAMKTGQAFNFSRNLKEFFSLLIGRCSADRERLG